MQMFDSDTFSCHCMDCPGCEGGQILNCVQGFVIDCI